MSDPAASHLKPTLLLMSGRFAGFLATFLVPVVLVRIFDQAEFGTYKQLFLLYATIFGVAQLGMAESLFYFLPRSPERGGPYAANAMLVLLGSGLASWALLVACGSKLSGLLSNGGLSRYLGGLGAFLTLMLASAALEIVLISRRRYGWASLSYGISDVARGAAFVVPVVFLGGLKGLLLGGIAFAGLRLATMLLHLRREYGRRLRPEGAALREQIVYALPFQASVVLGILESSLHQYAVSRSFDAATFALYAVGCLQIPFVDLVTGPASNVMMVRMSPAARDGRSGDVAAAWSETTRALGLVLVPLVGLLLVVAHDLITVLFTRNYLASVPLFRIWSTLILLATLQTDGVLRAYADNRSLLALSFTRLALIAGLIGLFMSAWGMGGAVLVTLLAGVVGKGLALARIKRLMRVGLADLLPWRSLAGAAAAAALSALPASLVTAAPGLPGPARLVVAGLAYALCYAGLVHRFGLLSRAEKDTLIGLARRLGPRAAAAQEAGVPVEP